MFRLCEREIGHGHGPTSASRIARPGPARRTSATRSSLRVAREPFEAGLRDIVANPFHARHSRATPSSVDSRFDPKSHEYRGTNSGARVEFGDDCSVATLRRVLEALRSS